MARLGRGQVVNVWFVPPAGTSDLGRNTFNALSLASQAGEAATGKANLAGTLALAGKAGSAATGKANLVLAVEALAGKAGNAATGFGMLGVLIVPSVVITYPPARRPAGRATAFSGRYKPLSANLQGYRQAEVEAVMRGGVKVWRPRFELTDVLGNPVQPGLKDVTGAKVTYDETREIKGSLELTLAADERLRNAFGQYLVKPYVGIGPMRDGGFAEFSFGAYPWTRPKRSIEGITGPALAETWTIVLGDQLHFLQSSGPHSPLLVEPGIPVAAYVQLALYLAGFTNLDDFSGITWSDVPVGQEVWYTQESTARRQGDGTWQAGGQPETWLGIEKDLHKGLGWQEPSFDRANGGRYVARPDRVWWQDPPDVVYDTADDGVVLLPVTTEPDLSMIANWGKGWTQASSGTGASFGNTPGYFYGQVDLNDYLPAHPLAQVNSKRYYDFSLPNAIASSDVQLGASLLVELFKRLAFYEKMTLKRAGFLAQHEPPGIVGVQVAGDPELAGPVQLFSGIPDFKRPVALYRETGDTIDLFTGEATSTLTRLARIDASSP